MNGRSFVVLLARPQRIETAVYSLSGISLAVYR